MFKDDQMQKITIDLDVLHRRGGYVTDEHDSRLTELVFHYPSERRIDLENPIGSYLSDNGVPVHVIDRIISIANKELFKYLLMEMLFDE